MNTHRDKLSGVFAPVLTPFQGEKLLLDDLRENIRRLNETDLTGYLALGSNGEFKSLTSREQLNVLAVFAEERGKKVVIAGVGRESTAETIEKSHSAAEMGFDFVSVLTPSYFQRFMDGPTLEDFYQRVADAVAAPVLLYNAPPFAAGVAIPPDVVCRLASHKNIAGMKDSSSTGPGRFLINLDPTEEFRVLAGSATFFYPSLHLGATGGILSLANVLPEACCELYSLFQKGALEEGRDLHFRLARLNAAISGKYGVAGVKAAADLAGFTGGDPRHPLKPLPESARAAIREAILAEGFTLNG